MLQLSDITDSPCNEINITVSGYNGLDGEINSISGLYFKSGNYVYFFVCSVFKCCRSDATSEKMCLVCIYNHTSQASNSTQL